VLAIGDFNTCRAYLDEAGATDLTAHYLDAIEQIGFRDLWRHRYPERREYSWFSTRSNGFRIDHAFLSPELAASAGAVYYSHEERVARLSDHSPLILELADEASAIDEFIPPRRSGVRSVDAISNPAGPSGTV
jgi:exodeoxyribonuclease III